MNEPGPFDRVLDSSAARDKTARTILIGMGVLGAILLALVLMPGSPLRGGNNASSSTGVVASKEVSGAKLPKAPEGYEALSRVFGLEKPKGTDGPFKLTVSLLQPVSDGRNLGLYTNRNGKWERIAAATLINNGASAQGEVPDMPSNVAVLRRTGSAAQISGWLAPGAQVDAAALEVVGTVNPVDYVPNPDGTLAGSATQFNAQGKNVAPTVRAAQPKDVDAINAILASPDLRATHVAALVALTQQPGITGIDIDYRGIAPARRPDFNTFIGLLADRLHSANKTLTVTVPAPTKTGVQWDSGAYDWEELNRRVDAVRMIPEADPSLFYKRMDEVVAYLKPKIDLKKVVLVVSRQSREKGSDGLRTMPLREALTMASTIEVRTAAPVAPNSSVSIVGKNIYQDDGATGILWDPGAFAVAFSYPGRGGQRTVWIENSLSLAFRLDLARRSGFGGVAIEDISLDPDAPAFWEPLRAYAETGSVSLSQPNGALLRPVWQSQAGQIEAGQKGNIIWKAPSQAGPYDVSLIISDGVVRATQKVVLDVRPAGQPAAPTPTLRPGVTPSPTPRP